MAMFTTTYRNVGRSIWHATVHISGADAIETVRRHYPTLEVETVWEVRFPAKNLSTEFDRFGSAVVTQAALDDYGRAMLGTVIRQNNRETV